MVRTRSKSKHLVRNIHGSKNVTIQSGRRQILHKRVRTGNKKGRTLTFSQKSQKNIAHRSSKKSYRRSKKL